MHSFTHRLVVVTVGLVGVAITAEALRSMRAESPEQPSTKSTAATEPNPTSRLKPMAQANASSTSDGPLTESEFTEPLRRGMEAYAAAWVKERRQEYIKQGREVPKSLLTSVTYERIGGRKFMVVHLHAGDAHVVRVVGFVDGKKREALCGIDEPGKLPLTTRERERAMEETFGVKSDS